jgi:hypothetical protein
VITVENPLYVDGVLLLRDGDDLDLFWALPTSPHLAATPVGESSFTLLEYRKSDGSGGGFAGLEIELSTPAGASLVSATGRDNARVVPALFRSGDVSLLTLQGQDQSLVQSVLGATVAPLTAPFHAVFGLELTEQGAALLAQCATTPATPIGVVYQLQFLAQTPALHAHVTMDYSRIYDHFAVGLGFTYYVSVRLDAEFQWLVENGFVTVEITQFTDQADQQQQQQLVLDLVKARIEANFFTTSLPQDAGDAGLPGPLGPLVSNQLGKQVNSNTALFVLKARLDVQHELKQFDFTYDGHTVEELTHVVSGFVGAMLPGAPPPVIRQITADDPFFAALDTTVSVAVDYADLPDLRDASVTLSYGSHTQTYVATADTPGPFRFTCPLTPGQPDYTTHTEFHFDPSSTAGPATIASPDTTRNDRAFAVSSADAFTVLRMRATGAGLESDLVAQLRVAVRAVPAGGGNALVSDVLVLDSTHPQLDWYRRVSSAGADVQLLARTDWIDRSGNVHQGGDEVEVANGDYRAYGPIQELLTVHVAPALDWTHVTQLLIELKHDILGTVETKSALLTATTPATDLTLALDDVHQRTYQWRATATHTDGTTAVSDWTPSDQIYLPVTDPSPTQDGVQVVWIGDVGTTLALQVDFWVTGSNGTEQEVASALLQPNTPQTTVSLPGPPGSVVEYRYEVHRIDASGDTVVQSGHDDKPVLAVRSSA